MSNKIKAYFDDQSESITIETDAKKGDHIQISELTSFDRYIDKEINTKHKIKIINDYKNSEEYKKNLNELEESKEAITNLKFQNQELENKINSFKEQQKNIELTAIEEFRKSEEFKDLQKVKESNIKLQKESENLKEIVRAQTIEEFRKSQEFTDKLKEIQELNKQKNELSEQITDLKHSLNTFDLKKKNELNEIEQKFHQSLRDKDEQINILKKEIEYNNKRKKEMSIKQLGEDFEQECLKMYDESLGQNLDDSIFKKAELIDNTKADFVFEVYTHNINENKKENPLLGKVILEMKTEQRDSENKKTNKDHLKKLEKDRVNSKADIALLITELEREDNFYIKRDVEYKNIIIARPEAMVSLLSILRVIFLKNKDIILQEIEFKDKQAIIDEFNEFKNNLLTNSIKHINTNLETITKQADNIIESAKKILSSANVISESHLKTVKNKIEDFKITKLINKIKE